MKVYVCPICDHAMKGKYYCQNCHKFIKNPYYMEMKYSLDRTAVKKEKTKQKKRHRHYHIVWLLIVYLFFQIGIILYSQIPKTTLKKETEKDIELGEDFSDWSYETSDYHEIIEKGEESTGLTHFAVDGKEFTKKMQQILNDADFDVIKKVNHMENYIAFHSGQSEEYSYFKKMQTFYLTEDFMEYYRISKDSVSGRLIDTEIESTDFDQVCFFIRAASSLLFPDNKRKQKRVEKLDNYLEKLLGEETYFSEKIGTMIISGYTYTNQDNIAFHISLSSAENM